MKECQSCSCGQRHDVFIRWTIFYGGDEPNILFSYNSLVLLADKIMLLTPFVFIGWTLRVM